MRRSVAAEAALRCFDVYQRTLLSFVGAAYSREPLHSSDVVRVRTSVRTRVRCAYPGYVLGHPDEAVEDGALDPRSGMSDGIAHARTVR